jgi:4-aminobutyrate aminotransferase/(S)-3-amino-2-methylpropionate transaminase
MRALELVTDRRTKNPDKAAAQGLLTYAYERGVILLSCGTHGNAIRFLPPLTTTIEQLHEGLDVIEAGLVALA